MSRPNILLIVLDSVRAKNTTLHNHVNNTTPYLQSLIDACATHYTRAFAPSVWSLPSHASIFTGYHVVEHRLINRDSRLQPDASIWAQLSKEGYDTGLFTENPYLTELPVGLDSGFETIRRSQNIPFPEALNPREFVHKNGQGAFGAYLRACFDDDTPLRSILNGVSEKVEQDAPFLIPGSLSRQISAETYTEQFLDWHVDRDGSWAACLNFMDAHTPYIPGPTHDHWGSEQLRNLQAGMENQIWEFYGGHRPWWQIEALSALYDGAIHRVDAQIRRLTETLKERDEFEDTLIVIMGDHGEGFGERSLVSPNIRIAGHQARGIDEPLLHVPLVVKHPHQTDSRTAARAASLTNFPTLVDNVQVGEWDGTEFVPDGPVVASSYGLGTQKKQIASTYCDDVERLKREAHAIYEDTGAANSISKYVKWGDDTATVQVFDAENAVVVSNSDTNRVDEEVSKLSRKDILKNRETNLDDSTKRRLEDLGYV